MGPDCYGRAARALRNADFLLILAGAGMSADSGLGTYETMPSRYREFCDPAKLAAAPVAIAEDHHHQQQQQQQQQQQDDPATTPSAAAAARDEFRSFWWNFALQYASTEPHEGYAILDRWCHGRKLERLSRDSHGGGDPIRDNRWWVYTSNVDGHFKRYPSFRCGNNSHDDRNNEDHETTTTARDGTQQQQQQQQQQKEEERPPTPYRNNVCEIHGCALEFRCSCGIGYFDREAVPRMGDPWTRWNEGVETLARPSETCKLLTRTLEELRARKRRRERRGDTDGGDGDDVTGLADLPPKLLCEECRILPMRPNVLMFNDTDETVLAPIRVHRHRYQEWEAFVESSVCGTGGFVDGVDGNDPSTRDDDGTAGKNFVLVELGCGTNVPAVRNESEEVLADTLSGLRYCGGDSGGSVTLIRINPRDSGIDGDDDDASAQLAPHVVSIPSTALEALRKIDDALDAILLAEEKEKKEATTAAAAADPG